MRLKYLICLSFLVLLGACGILAFKLKDSPYQLPEGNLSYLTLKKNLIAKFRSQRATQFYDRNGLFLGSYPRKTRHKYVSLERIPDFFQSYVVSAEDDGFYRHSGFHWREIFFAFWENVKVGRIKRGGSSITQQIAKNLFLDQKRAFTRKFYEIPWVNALERDLTKAQLLELYLNLIHLGPGLYGVEAASRYYYQKSVSELSKNEALYLTMIIPSPSRFNLKENPKYQEFLMTKKSNLLDRMVIEKKIDQVENDQLRILPFELKNYQSQQSWMRVIFENIIPYSSEKNITLSLDKTLLPATNSTAETSDQYHVYTDTNSKIVAISPHKLNETTALKHQLLNSEAINYKSLILE